MAGRQGAPTKLGVQGRKLWTAVSSEYELAEHELTVLAAAANTADLIAALQARIDTDGLMADSGRMHPALAEVRQQRITLARLLVALRIPADDDADGAPQIKAGAGRTQRRRGFCGIYAVGDQ